MLSVVSLKMKHPGVFIFALMAMVRGLTGHADRINESQVESLEVMKPWTDFWLVRLIMNLFGYATVLVPGFIIIVYVRRTNYLDQPGKLNSIIWQNTAQCNIDYACLRQIPLHYNFKAET